MCLRRRLRCAKVFAISVTVFVWQKSIFTHLIIAIWPSWLSRCAYLLAIQDICISIYIPFLVLRRMSTLDLWATVSVCDASLCLRHVKRRQTFVSTVSFACETAFVLLQFHFIIALIRTSDAHRHRRSQVMKISENNFFVWESRNMKLNWMECIRIVRASKWNWLLCQLRFFNCFHRHTEMPISNALHHPQSPEQCESSIHFSHCLVTSAQVQMVEECVSKSICIEISHKTQLSLTLVLITTNAEDRVPLHYCHTKISIISSRLFHFETIVNSKKLFGS